MKHLAISFELLANQHDRNTEQDFARFFDNARGSASELEHQLLLAYDLQYIPQDTYEKTNAEFTDIKRMLDAFIQKLRYQSPTANR